MQGGLSRRSCAGLLLAALTGGAVPAAADTATGSPADAPTDSPAKPTTSGHSWLVPAVETLVLDLGIWGIARVTNGTRSPDWSIRWPDVILEYPFRRWQFDLDDFDTNQFLHPYQGSLSFTAARSSGLGFWESSIYPILGSLVWELFLETQAPSVNDQITSSLGGVFLGEALFRSSDMILLGGGDSPGVLRQVGAFLVAPVAGLNRLIFGYPTDVERPISSFSRFSAGAGTGWSTSAAGSGRTGAEGYGAIEVTQFGVGGWKARRPFEHFDLSVGFAAGAGVSPASGTQNAQWHLLVRGLLVPGRIDGGPRLQGLWGLFGGYDYDQPGALRVSTSSLGLGASGEWDLGGARIQATGIASWVVLGNSDAEGAAVTLRSYKVGPAAQALLDARILLGDRAWVRLWGREYLLGGAVGSSGWEEITRASASVLVRLLGPHALAVEAEVAARSGHYPGIADDRQRASFVRIGYCFLTDVRLGAVLP
jgi:hypothetical protein